MGGNSGVVDEDAVLPVNNGAPPSSGLSHESHAERRSKCLEKLQVLDKALKVRFVRLHSVPFFSCFRFVVQSASTLTVFLPQSVTTEVKKRQGLNPGSAMETRARGGGGGGGKSNQTGSANGATTVRLTRWVVSFLPSFSPYSHPPLHATRERERELATRILTACTSVQGKCIVFPKREWAHRRKAL
jgi:hypothetical protein